MELGLAGHRVVVTGAASGIGLAIAQAFQAEGAVVWICDTDRAALSASGFPGHAVDVADRAGAAAFVDAAAEAMGGLDTLVSNAGIAGPTGPIDEIAGADWDRCIEVCLTGAFNVTRAAVPHLRRSQNGSITVISSLAGRLGFQLRTPYAAAKWGLIGLVKSLSIELGAHGIRANAVLPGIVAGARQRRVLEAKAQRLGISFDEVEARAFAGTSIKEYVTAQEIADQVVCLSAARARRISGQAISVCGDTQMLS
jgi:NAD(P)-dependent dehydrogenase (short-subunit alcohol dehydrogenase family)